MQIILDRSDDLDIELNEYLQFSLYDKDGKATHFQCTDWRSEETSDVYGWYAHKTKIVRTLSAYRIKQLTVETAEEKIAKEAVKKAEESLKAAKDTLKAVKDKK